MEEENYTVIEDEDKSYLIKYKFTKEEIDRIPIDSAEEMLEKCRAQNQEVSDEIDKLHDKESEVAKMIVALEEKLAIPEFPTVKEAQEVIDEQNKVDNEEIIEEEQEEE